MANNIRISAIGSFGAGEYESIVVTGAGQCDGARVIAKWIDVPGALKFTGDEMVQAENFTCTGICDLHGKLTTVKAEICGRTTAGQVQADQLDVMGQLKVEGTIEAANLDLSGLLTARGGIQCGSIDVTGQLKGEFLSAEKVDVDGVISVSGPVEAGEIEIDGVLKAQSTDIKSIEADGCVEVKENLICGTFKGDGTIRARNIEANSFIHGGISNIGEQLSADIVDIAGCIRAKEIVGDQIKIGRPVIKSWPHRMGIFGWTKMLNEDIDSQAELIEATTIELHYVKAKQVNGQNIVIGKKCEIECVDCSGTLSIAPDASVGKITGNYRRV